jgi:hypothetical protein
MNLIIFILYRFRSHHIGFLEIIATYTSDYVIVKTVCYCYHRFDRY